MDQGWDRFLAGDKWEKSNLTCHSAVGTALDPFHVRRAFRTAIAKADGVNAAEWTPRELRHGFVSLLSGSGVPLEEISRSVGHSRTAVTEEVYRRRIRPVIQAGATGMGDLFFEHAPELSSRRWSRTTTEALPDFSGRASALGRGGGI
ncbi:tyrosine-type recombinase/integrase [Kitasatospora sp. NPDC058218]|uniref:tyrosine-type recombinase/integrase n=1 Tax=Kitasatospora sp. NPDC058218 TaxID=3346385 RepID=UPI0036DB8037